MPPLRNVCKLPAKPLKTRLLVPFPLTTDTPPAVVAVNVPVDDGTLNVSVNVSSEPAFPSPRPALVNNNEDDSPEVMFNTLGRLEIRGVDAAGITVVAIEVVIGLPSAASLVTEIVNVEGAPASPDERMRFEAAR